MKHASSVALDRLELLLKKLRKLAALKEKSRGVFYRNGRAFLHFHEDPEGLFADVRFVDEFVRLEVTKSDQRAQLLKQIRESLDGNASTGR